MSNLFKIILILIFFALPSYGEEVEWNDKPVLCGEDVDIFGLIANKDERLVFKGIIGSKVRDPDNADGLADNMDVQIQKLSILIQQQQMMMVLVRLW